MSLRNRNTTASPTASNISIRPSSDRRTFARLYDRWPKLPSEEKRKVVEALIEKVMIGHGEIAITFSRLPTSEELCKNQQRPGERVRVRCGFPGFMGRLTGRRSRPMLRTGRPKLPAHLRLPSAVATRRRGRRDARPAHRFLILLAVTERAR